MAQKDVNEREIILDILLETEKGVYLAPLVRQVQEKYAYLPERSRAFIKHVCEGVLERKITLDYLIDQVSSVKTKKQKPLIRQLLRMSLYQLKYMDSVPDSAVINEAVKLAKKRHFGNLSGFVNAVLRNLSRMQLPSAKDFPNRSIAYSIPEWIVEMLDKKFGEDNATLFMEASFKAPACFARICEPAVSSSEFCEKLIRDNIEAEIIEGMPRALRLNKYDRIFDSSLFQAGAFTIQDLSSQLVGIVSEVKENSIVFDLCAAPGGKTAHIAELMKGTGCVYAFDKTDDKVLLIEENIQRLMLNNVQAKAADATVFRAEDENKADLIIADLPCSGLGVLSRKSDIRYRLIRDDITELAALQRQILDNAVRYLKKGGTLIYSTCTLTEEENEKQVEYLINEKGLKPVSFEALLPEVFKYKGADKGYLQLLQGRDISDGFFISKFVK